MTTFTSLVRNLILMIDWNEAQATAIHALKVAIVLTLLAGRATRWVWDSLPEWSESMGQWYSSLITGDTTTSTSAAVRAVDTDNSVASEAVSVTPTATVATPILAAIAGESVLLNLSNAQLRQIAGTRRKLAKKELVILAQDALMIAM
jgi:hypothetical protein